MSVDVTLDDALEGSLKEKFVLTEEHVNGFKINQEKDTARFVKEYLIPYIFSEYTDAFRDKGRANDVSLIVPRILNLQEDDFDKKEEYASFKQYMNTLFDKIENLEVVDTVDSVESIKGADSLFGKDVEYEDGEVKQGTGERLLGKLKGKTFRQLSNPSLLGDTTRGTEEDVEGSAKIMSLVDAGKPIFRNKKDLEDVLVVSGPRPVAKPKNNVNGVEIVYELDMEKYFRKLFSDFGYDMDENFSVVSSQEANFPTEKLEEVIAENLKMTREGEKSTISQSLVSGKKETIDGRSSASLSDAQDAVETLVGELRKKGPIIDLLLREFAMADDFLKTKDTSPRKVVTEGKKQVSKPKQLRSIALSKITIVIEVPYPNNTFTSAGAVFRQKDSQLQKLSPVVEVLQDSLERVRFFGRGQLMQATGRSLVVIEEINEGLDDLQRLVERL
jgi:hypothetical protein